MKKKLVSALLCATMAASLLAGVAAEIHPTQEALARKAMQKLK